MFAVVLAAAGLQCRENLIESPPPPPPPPGYCIVVLVYARWSEFYIFFFFLPVEPYSFIFFPQCKGTKFFWRRREENVYDLFGSKVRGYIPSSTYSFIRVYIWSERFTIYYKDAWPTFIFFFFFFSPLFIVFLFFFHVYNRTLFIYFFKI